MNNDWLVAADAMERVQAGVMRRIRRRRMVRRGVALGVLGLGILLWPATPDVETLALRMPLPPPAPEWVPVHAVRPATRPKPEPAKVVLAKAASKITLYTADPDVVFVLVADGGEE